MSITLSGRPLGIGIVGCGNISSTYLRLIPLFGNIIVRAVADLDSDARNARAAEFGVRSLAPDALLAADDVDIVLNLTPPAAHVAVSSQALRAGKHVYSEKPFVPSLAEGRALMALAAERGLLVASAPDTFLGGAHQRARALVDAGTLGTVAHASAHVMSAGHEYWHPDPDFYYQPGGGPLFDMGPYYLSCLVQLLGPVARVTAMSVTPRRQRRIHSGPRAGESITVRTPTTLHAVYEMASGTVVTLGASWDSPHSAHPMLELHGEQASLRIPDPNFFGGDVALRRLDRDHDEIIENRADVRHPFEPPNESVELDDTPSLANYRGAGLADMAAALTAGREPRCSAFLALHVVEAMEATLRSATDRRFVDLETRCERPAPLDAKEASDLLVAAAR